MLTTSLDREPGARADSQATVWGRRGPEDAGGGGEREQVDAHKRERDHHDERIADREDTLRFVPWNVARKASCNEQVEALQATCPDIVALQETTVYTVDSFRQRFPEIGQRYIASSLDQVLDPALLTGPRYSLQFIASKWPVRMLPAADQLPWPERLLSVIVDSPWGPIEVHNVHAPHGEGHPAEKLATFEKLYEQLAHRQDEVRILCGDFNTPKEETPEGNVVTWGEGDAGWDRVERNILTGLADFDLVDVYWLLHGYSIHDCSWYNLATRNGHRYDHIFAPRQLNPVECRYVHSFRESRLSDHSAVEACFVPSPPYRMFA